MSAERSGASAVVLVPPAALWPAIQAHRREHDRHVDRWMPHVTLLHPFVPHDAFAAARATLARVCAGVAPFGLRLGRVRRFDQGSVATLWLAPEPAGPVIRLQQALWEAFPDYDDTRRYATGFVPHLSLGQVPADEAEGLARRIQEGWTALDWRVDEVALIARDERPDSVFAVDRAFPLGG